MRDITQKTKGGEQSVIKVPFKPHSAFKFKTYLRMTLGFVIYAQITISKKQCWVAQNRNQHFYRPEFPNGRKPSNRLKSPKN